MTDQLPMAAPRPFLDHHIEVSPVAASSLSEEAEVDPALVLHFVQARKHQACETLQSVIEDGVRFWVGCATFFHDRSGAVFWAITDREFRKTMVVADNEKDAALIALGQCG